MDLSNKGFAQAGALVVGAVYAAVGVIGFFITGFGNFVQNTDDALLGFAINPFHNVVHLAVGVYLIIVSQVDRPVTEGALIGGGLVYLLATFLGFANSLQIISMNGAGELDNVLHLVSGSAALGLGLLSVARNKRSEAMGEPLNQR